METQRNEIVGLVMKEKTWRRRFELDVEVWPGSHMAGGRGNKGKEKEEGGVCLGTWWTGLGPVRGARSRTMKDWEERGCSKY